MNNKEMKCPICKDIFYTEIENENDDWVGNLLCMNCFTVFTKEGKIVERG